MTGPEAAQPSHTEKFVRHINAVMSRDGAARRALETGLRRWSDGQPPGAMHELVAIWLPDDPYPQQERAYYTVAALMTVASRSGIGTGVSLGAALGRASKKVSETTTRHSMRQLARYTRDGPYTHLRGGIRILNAAAVPVDWARLLDDLEAWGYRGPRVCTIWQQDYHRARARFTSPSDSE
jgi:CRISPR system Cascade subunit CasB